MCDIIDFDNIKNNPQKNGEFENELEHTILSFNEFIQGIDDSRLLHAKFSLFAKKLIEEGFDDYTVYIQMFKTASSMSSLYSDIYYIFAKDVHDHLTTHLDCLCYDRLDIDDIT